MPTGLQLAKQELAERVLYAVSHFEAHTGLTVLAFDIPLLKAEHLEREKAITTSEEAEG